MLGITFCLGIVFGAFNVGFRWYWVSRCLEGCYEAVTTGTGSEGPEQVCVFVWLRSCGTCSVLVSFAEALML